MTDTQTTRPTDPLRRQGTVLVTGATGAVGRVLVDRLLTAGVPLRVMSRRAEQVEDLRRRGAQAVQGGLPDQDALRRALEGCEQLFLLCPNGPDQLAVDTAAVDAAVAAGVRHVVKVSASDVNPASRIPWARDHALGEEHLRRSGLAWTVLRPGAFLQNLLTEAAAVRRGWLPQTSGHGATVWVDAVDIAEVAARVLQEQSLQGGAGDAGRTYVLTGDRPLSYPEIARELSAVLGHRVRYVHVPAPVLQAGLRLSGVPAWKARGLHRQFVDVVRRGEDGGRLPSDDLPRLLGRPARTVADFARDHRDALARGGGPSGR